MCSGLLVLQFVESDLVDLAVGGDKAYFVAGFVVDADVGGAHVVIQKLHDVVGAVPGANHQVALAFAVAYDGCAFAEDVGCPDPMSECSCAVK